MNSNRNRIIDELSKINQQSDKFGSNQQPSFTFSQQPSFTFSPRPSSNQQSGEQLWTKQRKMDLSVIQPVETITKFEAKTVSNDGRIITQDKIYDNKCFFISVSNGLELLSNGNYCKMHKLNGKDVSDTYYMAHLCEMLNNDVLDTDNKTHIEAIIMIANKYNVQIDFFIGRCENDRWYTTSSPHVSYNKSNDNPEKKIIRILNKVIPKKNVSLSMNTSCHFELLLSIANGTSGETVPFQSLSDTNDGQKEFINQQIAQVKQQNKSITPSEQDDLSLMAYLFILGALLLHVNIIIGIIFIVILGVYFSKIIVPKQFVDQIKNPQTLLEMLQVYQKMGEQIDEDETLAKKLQYENPEEDLQ